MSIQLALFSIIFVSIIHFYKTFFVRKKKHYAIIYRFFIRKNVIDMIFVTTCLGNWINHMEISKNEKWNNDNFIDYKLN